MTGPALHGRRVAWLGLGIMGSRMAANLRAAGAEVVVWNRTRATADAWAARHGAAVAATPAAAAAGGEICFSMVVDGPQVEALLLGPHGVATAAPDGLLCVDCSTIGAVAARRVGAALATRGVRFVDAPVTGSAPRAEDGTLTIMAGGERSDVERARPFLEAMGGLVVHAGPLGDGQLVKLINNAVAAVNAAMVGEALVAARAAGADLDVLVAVMASGSGGSAMLDLKAGPMRAGDRTPLFRLAHMLKDVNLCLAEGEAAGAPLPLTAQVRETLVAAVGRDLGDADFAALVEVQQAAAGVRLDDGSSERSTDV